MGSCLGHAAAVENRWRGHTNAMEHGGHITPAQLSLTKELWEHQSPEHAHQHKILSGMNWTKKKGHIPGKHFQVLTKRVRVGSTGSPTEMHRAHRAQQLGAESWQNVHPIVGS